MKIDYLTGTNTATTKWNSLRMAGGLATGVIFVLFLIGLVGTVISGSTPIPASSWLSSLQNNWLVVLFKLNIGMESVGPDSLNVLNPVDIVIMALFGVLFFSLLATLSRTSRIWSAVATSLPVLGMVVFLITQTAGRSGLLIGGLIYSIIMLRSDEFTKLTAYTGIFASALLFFAGDIGTALFSASYLIAISIAIGYVIWMAWFLLTGLRLIRLGRVESLSTTRTAE